MKFYDFFSSSHNNLITHLCLLIDDGYAWAIAKATKMKTSKRINQVDMIIFYMNRDFACDEIYVYQYERRRKWRLNLLLITR
jgi:hypothetical protein